MIRFLLSILILTINFSVNSAEIFSETDKYRSKLVARQDELLEFLLQIPFEQRQYIFPMLSAEQTMPKKIRTHPEVVVWKGKKPTRIAKRFENDTELINDLPEQFYYFLAPEVWPEAEDQYLENDPNKILQNMIFDQKKSPLKSTGIPEELADVYSGLKILEKHKIKVSYPLYFEKALSKPTQELTIQITQKTGLSPQLFGKKLDEIATAYRSYTVGKLSDNFPQQPLVQNYWSIIPFIFQKTGFEKVLDYKLYPN